MTVTTDAADGLYFRRNEDGSVTILKTSDGKEPNDAAPEDTNVIFAQTIAEGPWISTLLNMTVFGERPGDWNAWLMHHRGEKDVIEGRRGGY
jgi:hypothetical protein